MPVKKVIPPLITATAFVPPPVYPGSAAPAGERKSGEQAGKPEISSARFWVKEALLGLEVRSKLLAQIKTTDALRVHIAIDGQDATLTGELEKQSNLALAETLTRSVKGVRQVNNQLTCLPADGAARESESTGERVAHEIKDALLETKIKTKLLANSGVGTFKIEVKAMNGVVKLSGTVPDGFHHDEAMRITRETSAVREVRDLLKIKPADTAN